MNSSDEGKREVEALRERSSSLSGAVLRISASLDVGTVLRETVDSARALTGARYGAITTIDEAGRPQAAGLRHLRPHRRRAAAAGGLTPRDALLRAPA